MAFRSLIQGQVRNALRLIGDLGTEATFTNTIDNSYDFGSQTSSGTDITGTATVFIAQERKSAEDTSMNIATIYASSEELEDVSLYSQLTVGINDYEISGFNDNGFLVEIQATRKTS